MRHIPNKINTIKKEKGLRSPGETECVSDWQNTEGSMVDTVSEVGPGQWSGCRGGTQIGAGHSMKRQKREMQGLDAGKQQSISQNAGQQISLVGT